MAVQFEFYKNPQANNKEGETSYHPRVVNFQQVSTQKLAQEIHKATTFGASEVEAMLTELARCMGNHLREGERVHLNGIGYFQITLQATEPIGSTAAHANKVKLKTISFLPEKGLKSMCAATHLRRSVHGNHSTSLTKEEIDRKLDAHFATHPILTRNMMQLLCGFTQSMAGRHLRRLKEEGKLKNIGKPTQPIYVPAEGHYNTTSAQSPENQTI